MTCHWRQQVLKLEIGGDAHSTINTESSHMHTPDPAQASFDRGWEIWLATEAKKRNPNIRLGGLAWGWQVPLDLRVVPQKKAKKKLQANKMKIT